METVSKKKTSSISSLEEALDYQNDMLIYKFLESYNISFEEASAIFEETKKWMWLCAKGKELLKNKEIEFPLFIDKSMLMIDEMWHTFILFTKEYQLYCKEKFGFYLHHAPTTKEEKEHTQTRIKADKRMVMNEMYERTKRQYEVIFDLLGEETLTRWYKDYANQYTVDKINELRKPIAITG